MLDHKNVEKFREELKADSSKNQSKIKGDKQSSDPNKANALYKGGDKENQNKVSKQGSMSSNNGETVQTSLVDGSTESSQLNPDEVISLIGLQWQDELKRVKQIDLQQTNKKEITSTTLVREIIRSASSLHTSPSSRCASLVPPRQPLRQARFRARRAQGSQSHRGCR